MLQYIQKQKMINKFLKEVGLMDRVDYQNKILDIIDKALNDLNTDDFYILIRIVQEYIDDLNQRTI